MQSFACLQNVIVDQFRSFNIYHLPFSCPPPSYVFIPTIRIMPSLLSTTLHAYPTSILKRPQLRHQHLDKKFLRKKIDDQRRTPQSARASWQFGGDDFRTIKRIIRLNSAVQNRSFKELFELVGDECKNFCSSLPAIDPFGFSKKLFGMILALMVRNNVMFVIKPSIDNGVDVGVKWMLEWKNNLPSGFGLNVKISHVYKGAAFIRKGDSIIDPLLRVKHLQLDLEKILLPMIDKVLPKAVLEGKWRVIFMYCLLSLVIMVISYALLKNIP